MRPVKKTQFFFDTYHKSILVVSRIKMAETINSTLLRSDPSDWKSINLRLRDSISRFVPCTFPNRMLFLTHPKNGTMLTRNMILHFAGIEQTHVPLLMDVPAAMTAFANADRQFYYGHVPAVPEWADMLAGYRKVLQIRNPVDTIVALARASLDPRSERADHVYFRESGATVEDLVPLIVDGYDMCGIQMSPFNRSFQHFVLDWVGQADEIIQFEQVLSDVSALMAGCGSETGWGLVRQLGLPACEDWRERLVAGACETNSTTYLPPFADDRRASALRLAASLLDPAIKASAASLGYSL